MKLCLIGSTKFMDRYVGANRKLTLEGHVVYTVATISTQTANRMDEPPPVSDAEKQILDLVHLRKIQESEGVVLITDETGYIGFSTRREIQWAQMIGRPIFPNPQSVPPLFYGLL